MNDHSITQWLSLLKAGEVAAAQPLWERYYRELAGLARKRLGTTPRRIADEEDVVLSAFHSFFAGAEAGRFPRLENRDDLWQILIVIAARKAADQIQSERRQKRGGGAVRGESVFMDAVEAGVASDGLDGFPAPDPTPEWSAQVAEEYGRLLALLGQDDLQRIAVWKMEGETNDEIAQSLGCAVRTVERKLLRIRAAWKESCEQVFG